MVFQAILGLGIACRIFFITAVLRKCGDQLVGVICVIVYLSGLETYLVHTDLFSKTPYIIYLVLVGFYHQELEKNKRRFAIQLFFPFNDVACTLQHFVQLATYTVLLVNILRGAVDGDYKPV